MFEKLMVTATLAVVLHGSLTFYAPGVFETVYQNRLAWGHVKPCADCTGYLAVLDRKYLGRQAYVQTGATVLGPLLIVDVAADKDRERLRRRGLVAEIDHANAMRLGMAGPRANVTVWIVGEE
jgi:hypothetical protein